MALDWSRVHASRKFGPLTLPLALCSWVYGLGVRANAARLERRGPRRLPGFLLSVGNLTVGGAGKTPAACTLAQWARKTGYRVAVLSRGYGGSRKDRVLVVSDGRGVCAGPDEAGDEPVLLARALSGVPVVVSKTRYQAGKRAHEEFDTDFYILDDGFQHRALARDLDLVLVDARDPVGNGRLLPWGPLREPAHQVGRANAVLLTRTQGWAPGQSPAEEWLSRFDHGPCFRSVHQPGPLVFSTGKTQPASSLKGMPVVAFCGIAKPGAFQETLEGLGANVRAFRGFRDHHAYNRREVEALEALRNEQGADLLVTTEKDWVRSMPILESVAQSAFLRVSLEIGPGREALFRMIQERAAQKGVTPEIVDRG